MKREYVYQSDGDLRVEDSQAVQKYQDLRVYQIAFDSATEIFKVPKKWPAAEKFSLTDQIRRSSRSVCGNIAEAWRKRRYPAHFASKLSDSDSEAAETEVWLDFAQKCGYLTNNEHAQLQDSYDHICSMLIIMISNADKWCQHIKRR